MKITEEDLGHTLDYLRRRRQAYGIFASPQGQVVLQDLMQFCRGLGTVWDPDQRKTDVLIGRNEVWQRIQQHLGLTAEQLLVLYSGHTIDPAVLKPTKEPELEETEL